MGLRRRRALLVAVTIAVVGVAGALARTRGNGDVLVAATPDGSTTATTGDVGTSTTAVPSTSATPSTVAPSHDFVVDLPQSRSTDFRPASAQIYDIVLHADAGTGCVWATEASTGEPYSVAWSEGSTARFVMVGPLAW